METGQVRNEARRPRKRRNPMVRACLFWIGALLVVLSPLVGIIPGPGGVFFFAAGAALMLQNSHWAKKKYARFKRRYPRKGGWADWALRRPSYKRRMERAAAERDGVRPAEPADGEPDLRALEPGCKH